MKELAPGGDGVAIEDIDGERRAIFVPGVAEGERIRVDVDLSKRPARGRLLGVLSPSASRVAPACPHHGACGGCDYMFLDESTQRTAHAAIVRRVLPPAFAHVEITSHSAPKTLGYRTRARLHVEARRGSIAVGFLGRRTRELAVVGACAVLDPVLDAARAAMPSWLEGARGKGEVYVGLGAERRAVIDVRWSGDLPGAVFGRLERAVAGGALAGARVFAGDVKTPAVIGDPTPIIEGADGEPLRLAPGGFAQASEEGNRLLAARVRELARRAPEGACVELYAGSGNLTVLLARDRDVVAVESDRDACAAARVNLAARSLSARVVEADASAFDIPRATRLVVLDPPRTGAKEVARRLATSRVPAIVYVSCDPPTLGRDLGILVEGKLALAAIETFEMFPQTSHVETVALLTRGS